MQDSFSIISPAGFVMNIGFGSQPPTNGTGTYGPVTVTQPLPGGSLLANGVGVQTITPGTISGAQGTMSAAFTTGVSGTAQGVVFIAVSPTVLLGIALDALNRPYAILTDVLGNIVGESLVSGSVVAAGTPMNVQLEWNSASAVSPPLFAEFEAGALIEDWATRPVSVWTPFKPTLLYVGTALGGQGLGDFVGKMGLVQVSNRATFTVLPSSQVADEDAVTMAGSASMTATAHAQWSISTSMIGDSSVSANATKTP